MITMDQTAAKKERLVGDGIESAATFYGLSSDTKPEIAPNGSLFVEMNTSKFYFFDAASAEWKEWA